MLFLTVFWHCAHLPHTKIKLNACHLPKIKLNVSSNQHVHVLPSCHYRLSCQSNFMSPKWPFLGVFFTFNRIGLIFGYVVALVVLFRSCKFQLPTSFTLHHTTCFAENPVFVGPKSCFWQIRSDLAEILHTHRTDSPIDESGGFYEKSPIRLKMWIENCRFFLFLHQK